MYIQVSKCLNLLSIGIAKRILNTIGAQIFISEFKKELPNIAINPR